MAVVAFVEMVDGTSVAADLVDKTESRAAESAEVVEYKGPGALMLPAFGGLDKRLVFGGLDKQLVELVEAVGAVGLDKWLVVLVGAVEVAMFAEEGIAGVLRHLVLHFLEILLPPTRVIFVTKSLRNGCPLPLEFRFSGGGHSLKKRREFDELKMFPWLLDLCFACHFLGLLNVSSLLYLSCAIADNLD